MAPGFEVPIHADMSINEANISTTTAPCDVMDQMRHAMDTFKEMVKLLKSQQDTVKLILEQQNNSLITPPTFPTVLQTLTHVYHIPITSNI